MMGPKDGEGQKDRKHEGKHKIAQLESEYFNGVLYEIVYFLVC